MRRDVGATVLIDVQPPWLVERMARAAEWAKPTKNGNGATVADPEVKYANHLLLRAGEWEFPVLRGVLTAPTLARDGRVIEAPGFDVEIGLLLDFEPAPSRRCRRTRRRSRPPPLSHCWSFRFAASPSWTTRLVPWRCRRMLAALARPSLRSRAAPRLRRARRRQRATDAGLDRRAGSSQARLPAATSQGKTPEEDDKRLTTVLHAGDPVILIDNCDHPVQGDFLCSTLTQQIVQARILGKSERRILPCTALVMATGNNLALAGDVSRRAVICRLDARIERPDERPFDFDPLNDIPAQRPDW